MTIYLGFIHRIAKSEINPFLNHLYTYTAELPSKKFMLLYIPTDSA